MNKKRSSIVSKIKRVSNATGSAKVAVKTPTKPYNRPSVETTPVSNASTAASASTSTSTLAAADTLPNTSVSTLTVESIIYPDTVGSVEGDVNFDVVRDNSNEMVVDAYNDYVYTPRSYEQIENNLSRHIDANMEREANLRSNNNVDVLIVNTLQLQQIPNTIDCVPYLQNAINTLQRYMVSVTGFDSKTSIKRYFKVTEQQCSLTKLDYKILIARLLRLDVRTENIVRFSKMMFSYYVSIIQNLPTLAYIAINVNYTVDKTDIGRLLTYFINLCAHHVNERIFSLFEGENATKINTLPTIKSNENTLSTDANVLAIINNSYKELTTLYNRTLFSLETLNFYKFTMDNDLNENYSVVGDGGGNNNENRSGNNNENRIVKVCACIFPVNKSLIF